MIRFLCSIGILRGHCGSYGGLYLSCGVNPHGDTEAAFSHIYLLNSTQLKIFLLKIHKNIYKYINMAETQLGLFASVQIGSLTRNNTTFTTDKEG